MHLKNNNTQTHLPYLCGFWQGQVVPEVTKKISSDHKERLCCKYMVLRKTSTRETSFIRNGGGRNRGEMIAK